MHFVGATIIAGIIFFLLNFVSSLLFDGPQVTTAGALVEALLKTAVFTVLFYWVHNQIARLFRWYRLDEPEARHLLDSSPALDAARAEQTRRGA